MIIEFNEEIKPLDKAINFNEDNFFEYLAYIINDRNGEWFPEDILKNLASLLEGIPGAEENSFEIECELMNALCETSKYAYKAGFMEACRLMRILQSF